ncbi:MAG: hypothetical protein ABJG41_09905 [Cyclobacteriaceae bacterium]
MIQHIAQADEQILSLTGLNQEELNELRFNTAYEFLRDIMGVDEYGLEVMPQTPLFWSWWRNEWFRVDERFLSNLRYDTNQGDQYLIMPDRTQACAHSQELRLEGWKRYHEASETNYYMSREILELSYHKLIKRIVRQ